MAKLRKTPRLRDYTRSDGRQTSTMKPATSNEGRQGNPVKRAASSKPPTAASKLPQPKSVKSAIFKPEENAIHQSKPNKEALGMVTSLSKPTNKQPNAVTTGRQVQTYPGQTSTCEYCDDVWISHRASLQVTQRSNATISNTKAQNPAQDRDHPLPVQSTRASIAKSTSGGPLVTPRNDRKLTPWSSSLKARATRATKTTTANGMQSPCPCSCPNPMTASDLSKMYASCIPPHPASITVHDRLMQSPSSQQDGCPFNEDYDTTRRATNGCESAVASSQRAAHGTSGSAIPHFRLFFAKQLRQIDSQRPWLDPDDRSIHISRPFSDRRQELNGSVPQPYETLANVGEPPIHVRSATRPHIVESVAVPIEALPRTSTQLDRTDISSNGKGRRAATWSRLKSLTSKTAAQPGKAFGWRGKRSSSPASGCNTWDRSLHARNQRLLHDSYFDADDTEVTTALLTAKCPPERPPRPESLFSATEVSSERQYDEIRLSCSSSSALVSDESADEDEQRRSARHRRRAYFTLDGVTCKHPTRSELSIEISHPRQTESRFPSTTFRSPTIPLTSSSEAGGGENSPPTARLDVSTLATPFCDHFNQPIVSKHTSTRAWWEDSPMLGAFSPDQLSIHESELDRSESPSVKPKKDDEKAISTKLTNNSSTGITEPGSMRQVRLTQRGSQHEQCSDVSKRTVKKRCEENIARINYDNNVDRGSSPQLGSKPKEARKIVDEINHRRGSASTDSGSLGQSNDIHESSSGSSLEAKATALRHGKALKGLNEYEAAHAIESIPNALLSQCSLGLSEEQKNEMKPEPLRKMLVEELNTTSKKTCDREDGSDEDDQATSLQPFRQPFPYGAPTNSERHRHQTSPSPPPLPPRSKMRPRLCGDWSEDNVQDLKLVILGGRRASHLQSCNLTTISEEASGMLSDSEITAITAIRQPKSVTASPHRSPPSKAGHSDSASSSSSLNAGNWWSDEEGRTRTPGASVQASSKDTTPEKDGIWKDNADAAAPAAAAPAATAEDNKDDRDDSYDLEREILQYYLDKQRRDLDRSPKDRMLRELRRKAKADEEARLRREAEEEKRRLAEAAEQESQRANCEREERIKGVLRGLRGGSVEDSF